MTTGGEQSAMAQSYHRLARRVLGGATAVVRHDAFTNLVGAAGAMQGIVVIAGGGSIACGYTADGKEERAGGWGSLLGDEGSAFWIGRQAVIAASRAVDGRGAATRLARRIPAHFGVPTLRDVYRRADRGEIGVPQIAGLVPVVAECARAGDRSARAVLVRAADELAEAAVAVLKKMRLRGRATPVFVTGGVFREDRFLLPAFRRALRARAPKADIRRPRFLPVVGCALVALDAAGEGITDSVLETIERTLPTTHHRATP
jgi:N-acetylglucosamine kinase-like BadF-type ATPase